MSFPSIIKTNATLKFYETTVYLNFIVQNEPPTSTPIVAHSLETKIMRGLFYVHLYATLENSLNELFKYLLLSINAKNIIKSHFSHFFAPIFLNNELKSFKDVNKDKFLTKANIIFSELNSKANITINESFFASDLQNAWPNTIKTIMHSLGMATYEISPNNITLINEIVDKRNAVAHGRESAVTVGERFRTIDLRKKMDNLKIFIDDLIDKCEDYYNNKKYIKPSAKKFYQ